MPTFLAALGGSMGAWLGLSILSLIKVNTWNIWCLSNLIQNFEILYNKFFKILFRVALIYTPF